MEVKPGYKRTNVGVIPNDWGIGLIGDLATKVGSGITPTGGERVYKDDGRPFMRSQNVGWGTLLLDDIAFIDEQTHASFSATEIKLNDVLLNITGASIGRSAIADTRIEGGNVNQHVCIIRVDANKLSPNYVNLFLLSEMGQKQIDSFQAGGNRQGLNFGQIKSFRFPLPPLPEQRAIAAALSDVDSLLSALDALLAKKRLIKQGAMQELLTGKKRLPGFSGEWETKKFSDLVTVRKQKINPHNSKESLFCVELEHIEQGTGRLIGSTETDDIVSIKSVFRKGDVLFGKLRAYLRKYWLADRDGVCTTEIWPLIPNPGIVVKDYLFQLVQTDGFIESASIAYGTHMPRTDWNVVKNYEFFVPNVPEQTAIAKILSDMDAEIAALEARRAKTRLLKQGMMQELLTGRIRLI